jgi:putative pyruvate formate lyase activating enzyme
MSRTAPHKGEFRLLITRSGEVIAPDLTEPLLPVLRELGGSDKFDSTPRSCAVQTPRLIAARVRNKEGQSLLDRNISIGRRLLQNCTLCEHRCGVNRCAGETGFCGLGAGLSISGYSMLYNEGPFVGQPTFGVFLRGCSLRCEFCYRPKDLVPYGTPVIAAQDLADILDVAAEAGAKSWHFLGGNPDESVVGVLEALRLTKNVCPIVWNSALYLSPEALELLKGIVDIWLPDMKFGNDECAWQVAGVRNYSAVVRRNLSALHDEPFVVIRHMRYPGHENCCFEEVKQWIGQNMPKATLHQLSHVKV